MQEEVPGQVWWGCSVRLGKSVVDPLGTTMLLQSDTMGKNDVVPSDEMNASWARRLLAPWYWPVQYGALPAHASSGASNMGQEHHSNSSTKVVTSKEKRHAKRNRPTKSKKYGSRQDSSCNSQLSGKVRGVAVLQTNKQSYNTEQENRQRLLQ